MAAPANKTIGDLTGKWVMNKSLSDSIEPGLALQGIGFLTRKAIGLATVTLHAKQYTGPATPPNESAADQQQSFTHIDIEQTATGGIKGTSEHRCLDGESRSHSDWLFGTVAARSMWASTAGEVPEGAVGPDNMGFLSEAGAFLWRGWLEDEAERTGPEGAVHIFNIAVNEQAGWAAAQVWGFQTIGGERRHARTVIIKKGDQQVEMRIVYDYIPPSK